MWLNVQNRRTFRRIHIPDRDDSIGSIHLIDLRHRYGYWIRPDWGTCGEDADGVRTVCIGLDQDLDLVQILPVQPVKPPYDEAVAENPLRPSSTDRYSSFIANPGCP